MTRLFLAFAVESLWMVTLVKTTILVWTEKTFKNQIKQKPMKWLHQSLQISQDSSVYFSNSSCASWICLRIV